MTEEPIEIVRGSGNVFRDFGYPDADVRQTKALLGTQIMKILDEESLSTRQAEEWTGISHSDFSCIRQAKFSRFTIDRLINILGLLGQDVEVSIAVHRRAETTPTGKPAVTEKQTWNLSENAVSDNFKTEEGSGNIFIDLGFAPEEAEELSVKSSIIGMICDTIKARKLTQKAAADLCNTDQPTLLKVLRGRMEIVTVDRLTNWLKALGLSDAQAEITATQLTMREALRQVWEADCYPILGNGDFAVSVKLGKEALERAAAAVRVPDDEPQFAQWISDLRNPNLPPAEREEIMFALHDLFDPPEDDAG